ncbi:MAG: hypothetical protein K8R99_10770 [Actinomycetia bacterium]|nr:hypothetical protein [Actinomycetes bacterium]
MTNAKWSPQIARAMHELSNAAPAAPTTTTLRDHHPLQLQQPRLMVRVAAASIAAAAIVGLVLTLQRPDASQIAAPPRPTLDLAPSTPIGVLLPDPATPGVHVVSGEAYGALDESRGAVMAPDNTVFGFVVSRPGIGEPTSGAETRIISGHGVRAIADGSAPTEIYRTINGSCATLTVTTADEAMWSDNTLALIAGMTLDGSNVSVALPAGWNDLGSSAARPQHIYELSVDSQGEPVQLFLQQMPGVPAGWFLSANETAPRAVDLDGSTAWLVDGATTPGWHSIIGERDGIGFALSGMLASDELTSIARSLRTFDASNVGYGGAVTDTVADTNPDQPTACGEPTLTVTGFAQVVPEQQRDLLSDGVVTVDEYEAAFHNFEACAREHGGYVKYSLSQFTGEFIYETSGDLLPIGDTGGGDVNKCYQAYFAQTEVLFSSTNPQVLANLDAEQIAFFNETIRPCLESAGVEVPDNLFVGSNDWIRLLEANTAVHQAGLCGGIPPDTTAP